MSTLVHGGLEQLRARHRRSGRDLRHPSRRCAGGARSVWLVLAHGLRLVRVSTFPRGTCLLRHRNLHQPWYGELAAENKIRMKEGQPMWLPCTGYTP
ncbi:MAG: hypothetical protein JW940_29060 [Polyangiaceae bacterium]|nr:hypothetical protein [Polyangiaceae bacterium]